MWSGNEVRAPWTMDDFVSRNNRVEAQTLVCTLRLQGNGCLVPCVSQTALWGSTHWPERHPAAPLRSVESSQFNPTNLMVPAVVCHPSSDVGWKSCLLTSARNMTSTLPLGVLYPTCDSTHAPNTRSGSRLEDLPIQYFTLQDDK